MRLSVLFIFVCLTALGVVHRDAKSAERREEILAFDPAAVTEIKMSRDGLHIVASRLPGSKSFKITQKKENKITTCKSNGDFYRIISSISTFWSLRPLSEIEASIANKASRIDIDIEFGPEMNTGIWQFYLSKQKFPVVGRSENSGKSYELDLPAISLERLSQGCRTKGAR
ncbi:hypothetical protein J2Y55_004606 [Bosea sp. BE125]|uniref:hypothetical protein n=1 Tax=Bosea sp. BE125 TaxID=2817909 RepID=UPI002856F288|nr:hypothetical protein [Bosea sp. BE125]MDR6873579.1 hypothetical protein [Bosea sp. BE125]